MCTEQTRQVCTEQTRQVCTAQTRQVCTGQTRQVRSEQTRQVCTVCLLLMFLWRYVSLWISIGTRKAESPEYGRFDRDLH